MNDLDHRYEGTSAPWWRETSMRRILLGSSLIGAMVAGLFVDSLALTLGIWLACVMVAAWATSPIWLDMQRGIRPFNYGTLLQLIAIALLGLNGADDRRIALPCAVGGLILTYTVFRNPAERFPSRDGKRNVAASVADGTTKTQ